MTKCARPSWATGYVCLFYGKWSKGLLGKRTQKAFHNLNQPKIAFLWPVPFLHTWDICGAIVPHGWDFCVLRATAARSASSIQARPGTARVGEEREHLWGRSAEELHGGLGLPKSSAGSKGGWEDQLDAQLWVPPRGTA